MFWRTSRRGLFMRRPIIAGNWKMYKTIQEAVGFVEAIKGDVENTDVEVVICCPYTCLSEVKKAIKVTKIKLGAQNMHWEDFGAYTGEISPMFLQEIGVDYVIVGHSERRQYFLETDELVNKKLLKALDRGIKPILCVGESLDEREKGLTNERVREQVLLGIEGVSRDAISEIVIAYEPIWAIGTGKTASAQDANEVIAYIRKIISEKFDDAVSEAVRIQYGGSVKPANAAEIMQELDIDGALVGGASLEAVSFLEIVNF
jgi:triosephosphate isomerase